ncbi:MAG: methylenetetrahydrofolate reductase C-terminal domain-containing protein [Candidatus Omnitrophota bacterium]
MIITKQKPLQELFDILKDERKVFLIGCTLCATTCKTGGEDQLKKTEKALLGEGKKVTGWAVLDPACNLLEVKRFHRKNKEKIDGSDAIVSFTCGGGTQAIVDIIREKKAYPGNDTLFQGEISKLTPKEAEFTQKCSLCGECALAVTRGICPVTMCPKSLANGPCGGIKDGKCEVDNELDCAWLLIYDRLKEFDQLDEIKKIRTPKDHSKSKKPQSLTIK